MIEESPGVPLSSSLINFKEDTKWFFTVFVEMDNCCAISWCDSPSNRLIRNTSCCFAGSFWTNCSSASFTSFSAKGSCSKIWSWKLSICNGSKILWYLWSCLSLLKHLFRLITYINVRILLSVFIFSRDSHNWRKVSCTISSTTCSSFKIWKANW